MEKRQEIKNLEDRQENENREAGGWIRCEKSQRASPAIAAARITKTNAPQADADDEDGTYDDGGQDGKDGEEQSKN